MTYLRCLIIFLIMIPTICVAPVKVGYASPKIVMVEIEDILLPPEKIIEIEPILIRMSWYGEKFHGKLTASGERFDMNSVSVAHVSLPFGTRVRFFNPTNNTQCDAVVNDSGPFDPDMLPSLRPHPKRQFDASRALAECLGFVKKGIINLHVVSIPGETPLTYDEIFSYKVVRSSERFAKIAN